MIYLSETSNKSLRGGGNQTRHYRNNIVDGKIDFQAALSYQPQTAQHFVRFIFPKIVRNEMELLSFSSSVPLGYVDDYPLTLLLHVTYIFCLYIFEKSTFL
ncbi:hypothetical protein AVEN_16504-1 [Araneus ventricosus]|uniref:Uncharacterized protein n=1 Tax=Araneus ventricosus TaxID=182803 RepID=A0A4Y2NCQ6_ARAVE|nr:hypothetical protein AVEN_16504-1 [Araneus ventricosus]